jgi:hypothetical protein
MSDFAAKTKYYSLPEIDFALADLRETMAIHKDKPADDPYVRKLWAEWDVLIEARRRKIPNPNRRVRLADRRKSG